MFVSGFVLLDDCVDSVLVVMMDGWGVVWSEWI